MKWIRSSIGQPAETRPQTKRSSRHTKGLEVSIRSSSVLGRRKKNDEYTNEDYRYNYDPNRRIYVVSDGVGGRPQGHEASRRSVNEVVNGLLPLSKDIKEGERYEPVEIEFQVKTAINNANKNVILPMAKHSINYRDFACTLDVVFLYNNVAYVGHVGDSRVYLFRKGNLKRITEDDVSYEEFHKLPVDKQHTAVLGSPKEFRGIEYSDKRRADSHSANKIRLSQCMGKLPLEPSMYQIPLEIGDIVLMATDGLTSVVHDEEIAEILTKNEFKDCTRNLVNRANYPQRVAQIYADHWNISRQWAKNSIGGADNITCISIKINGEE